jgi:hypothetical protein
LLSHFIAYQGQELVIFDVNSSEIARQPISPIKGVQVRNNQHKRDTSQSINDLIAHISVKFSNPDQAISFLEKVRHDNHRYARDQIRMIAGSVTGMPSPKSMPPWSSALPKKSLLPTILNPS